MTTLREAAQQALEDCADVVNGWESLAPLAVRRAAVESLDALKDALAEPVQETVQEPVAWLYRGNLHATDPSGWCIGCPTPLYTAPPPPLNLNDPAVQKRLAAQWGYAPQRKPLTEEQVDRAYQEIWRDSPDDFGPTAGDWIEAGIRYAERAHGIGAQE